MNKLVGFIFRAAFLALMAALLVAGFALARFSSWRADALAELAAGAEIYETASGQQQAAIRGEGEPVLVFHGAPGGYDQGLEIAANLQENGFRVISPSRPGYLGTPLAHRILPEQQAAAIADLLDSLGIKRAHVIGFSSGAPAAISFAASNPDRARSLTLISGILSRWTPSPAGETRPLPEQILSALSGDIAAALAMRQARDNPAAFVPQAMAYLVNPAEAAAAAEAVIAAPAQCERLAQFTQTLVPISPRDKGTRNDALQIRNLPELPLSQIACPTLVVSGTADPFASPEKARASCAKIPGAVFLPVEKSGHLIWLGPDAARAEAAILNFIKSVRE